MSEISTAPDTSPRKWCVRVAVQSFEGEPWAIIEGDDANGKRGPDGASPKKTLRSHIESMDKMPRGTFGSVQPDSFLNLLQECNEDDFFLDHVTKVEFALKRSGDSGDEAATQYQLVKPIDSLLKAVLEPAISATIEECVDSMVLVYGVTQEMKHLCVVGTPSACGLLPEGICMAVSKCCQRCKQVLAGRVRTSQSTTEGEQPSPVDSDPMGEGAQGENRGHYFVGAEATFVAFDRTTALDLLDPDQTDVEIGLDLGRAELPSSRSENGDRSQSVSESVTCMETYVRNACPFPVNNVNEALKALDTGLECIAHAVDNGSLPSDMGTSLLFSLTFLSSGGNKATFSMLCLAEDIAVQDWIASSVLSRDAFIRREMQSLVAPPLLRHNAVMLLRPLLYAGNVFISALLCVYNSVAALPRLTRDLSFTLASQHLTANPRRASPAGEMSSPFTSAVAVGYMGSGGRQNCSEDVDSRRSASRQNTQRSFPVFPELAVGGIDPRSAVCVPLSMDDRWFHEEELRRACRGEHSDDTAVCPPRVAEAPYSIVLTTASNETRLLLGRLPSRPAAEVHGGRSCYVRGVEIPVGSPVETTTPSGCGVSAGLMSAIARGRTDGVKRCTSPARGVLNANGEQLPSFDARSVEVVVEGTVNASECPVAVTGCVAATDHRHVRSEDTLCGDEAPLNACNANNAMAPPLQDGSASPSGTMGQAGSSFILDSTTGEMEALVDEFVCFYRNSCAAKDHVRLLERELARLRMLLEGKRDLEKRLIEEQELTRELREKLVILLAERESAGATN